MNHQMRVLLAVAVGASVSTRVVAAPDLSKLPPPASQEGLTYAKDIKPFFEASCVRCHSGQKAKAGLHLDSLEGVLNGSKDGKVITPGESAKSKLVIAVARLDPESAMPPKPKAPRGHPGEKKGEGGGPAPSGTNSPAGKKAMGPPPKPLTPEQVGLVRAWVDQGAK